jgi:glucose dehydrogenase
VALDAATGRVYWRYQHNPDAAARPCCGRVNRGLAILGDRVFMATIDAKLIALDVKTGQPAWQVDVADASKGYAMTLAPLVIKNKVIVGVAGGEYGVRGFIAATMPRPATRSGASTRFRVRERAKEATAATWQHGGASV